MILILTINRTAIVFFNFLIFKFKVIFFIDTCRTTTDLYLNSFFYRLCKNASRLRKKKKKKKLSRVCCLFNCFVSFLKFGLCF